MPDLSLPFFSQPLSLTAQFILGYLAMVSLAIVIDSVDHFISRR